MKFSYAYILASQKNGTLYVGVTGKDLKQRIWEHKEKVVESFTKKYKIDKLVYYELFEDINLAIAREKKIKAGPRKKKLELINRMNRSWRDLYFDIG